MRKKRKDKRDFLRAVRYGHRRHMEK